MQKLLVALVCILCGPAFAGDCSSLNGIAQYMHMRRSISDMPLEFLLKFTQEEYENKVSLGEMTQTEAVKKFNGFSLVANTVYAFPVKTDPETVGAYVVQLCRQYTE